MGGRGWGAAGGGWNVESKRPGYTATTLNTLTHGLVCLFPLFPPCAICALLTLSTPQVIRRAVASLPVGGGGGGGGGSSRSPPAIVADGNDLTVQAGGGDVIIETGTCGSLNPCDILGALTSLREV